MSELDEKKSGKKKKIALWAVSIGLGVVSGLIVLTAILVLQDYRAANREEETESEENPTHKLEIPIETHAPTKKDPNVPTEYNSKEMSQKEEEWNSILHWTEPSTVSEKMTAVTQTGTTGETSQSARELPVQVVFSKDSGFYATDVTVELKAEMTGQEEQEIPENWKILYTVSEERPGKNGAEYEKPIVLKNTDAIHIYSVKAVVTDGVLASREYEKTYITGTGDDNRYDMHIVAISANDNDLYSYTTGILVPGLLHDQKQAQTDGTGEVIYGNYSKRSSEWIRNGHVSIFDADGKCLADQYIGLGVSGGSSAHFNVKSLKLNAGDEYETGKDHFYMELDNCEPESQLYSYVDKYNSIRLRSGGQDMYMGNIRSAMASRLAMQSGFEGASSTNRALVFLNGEFYGIFDIQQNFSDSYLAARFGLEDKNKIEKGKGNERHIYTDLFPIADLFEQDLTVASNREALEKAVDMDNYLLYCAIRVAMNYTDWNNYEAWRYTGEYDPDNPYTDGRIRFLLYDTDITFLPDSVAAPFEGSHDNILKNLMEKENEVEWNTFVSVMKNSDYRDKFVNILCDLYQGPFAGKNLAKVIEEEEAKIHVARTHFYAPDTVKMYEGQVADLKKEALGNEAELRDVLEAEFGLSERYSAGFEAGEGVSIRISPVKTIYAGEEYRCEYYCGCNMKVEAQEYPGYVFDHWVVNGKKNSTKKVLLINSSIAEGGQVTVKAVVRKRTDADAASTGSGPLIVTRVCAKGDDSVEIHNISDTSVRLNDYYLSDSEVKAGLWQLPDRELAPGERIVFYGKNVEDDVCTDPECRMNFALKEGETAVLSGRDGGMIDRVKIIACGAEEYYERFDGSSDWVYVRKQ